MTETRTAPQTNRRGGRRGAAEQDGPRASFRDLLPYLTEHKRTLVIVLIIGVIGAATSLAQPLLVGQVIAQVEAGGILSWLVWALIGLVIADAVLMGYQHYLLQRTGTSVVLSARQRLVRRLLHLPISEFDQRRTGDLVSRVGSDTTLLYAVLTQGLVEAVGGILVFMGALIAMLLIDPLLLGLTVLVVVLAIVAVVLLSGRIRKASLEQQTKVGDLASAVERSISAVRTIRAANATERELVVVEEQAKGAWRAGLKVARISAFMTPIAGIAMQLSFIVVLGVGGFRVASGAISIASLVSFIMFLFLMIMPLGQAFGAFSSVNQALGALGRIQEILRLPRETDADTAPAGTAPGEAAIAVEFVDVEFGYPESAHKTEAEKVLAEVLGEHAPGAQEARARGGSDLSAGVVSPASPSALQHAQEAQGAERAVLRGVSFQVPRGSRTALVGPSGAGKSTILALIERFYDPTGGEIRMGGTDTRAVDRAELRRRIGYVEQDAPVLAGTLRENLLLGSPEATEEDCIAVLHSVNLGEVLDRDPAGLDAAVGEDGVMLSGGERQRLAIARALLAAPPILLLDESTSSLDGLNEQLLREAIDAVAEDRTLIVIAHRLSTVVDSDQIVVLDHGRVVGTGTHSELVKTTPLYKDLAKHQLLV